MAEVKAFSVAKKRREPIKFTIEGDDHIYTFTPPKIASAILPVFDGESSEAKASLDWIGLGLDDEDNKHLIDRLKDPKDDLDFQDLGDYIEGLMEEIAGRPTS